jgi:hypothetical protein
MKKLNLDITIDSPRENVWDAIVNDKKFRFWTSAFQEGSYFEGGWNKGDAIRFIAINKEGKKEGMVSEIAESIYPEHISIRHLGYIMDGIEDTTSEKVREWAPSYENYTLQKVEGNKTLFKLEMDITEEYYQIFLEMWPRALKKLKEVCEMK